MTCNFPKLPEILLKNYTSITTFNFSCAKIIFINNFFLQLFEKVLLLVLGCWEDIYQNLLGLS